MLQLVSGYILQHTLHITYLTYYIPYNQPVYFITRVTANSNRLKPLWLKKVIMIIILRIISRLFSVFCFVLIWQISEKKNLFWRISLWPLGFFPRDFLHKLPSCKHLRSCHKKEIIKYNISNIILNKKK